MDFFKELLLRYLAKYAENPTPFTWTKGPGHFQKIIKATKEYQAAHPKVPKERKTKPAGLRFLTAVSEDHGISVQGRPQPGGQASNSFEVLDRHELRKIRK